MLIVNLLIMLTANDTEMLG